MINKVTIAVTLQAKAAIDKLPKWIRKKELLIALNLIPPCISFSLKVASKKGLREKTLIRSNRIKHLCLNYTKQNKLYVNNLKRS